MGRVDVWGGGWLSVPSLANASALSFPIMPKFACTLCM